MSFILEVTKNGKDIILFNSQKYRESYSLKNSDIVWRCLGRICKASIKTNNEKTAIYYSNDTHSGPHPVTMRALTLTPPQQRCLLPTTPVMETQASRSTATTSTPALLQAAATPSSTQQNLQVARSPLLHKESPPLSITTAFNSLEEPPHSQLDLLAENVTLKEEITELRTRLKVVLDHSIESDQRLLQYTDQIFTNNSVMLASPSKPEVNLEPSQVNGNKSLNSKEEQELIFSRKKIKELERRIASLSAPCKKCKVFAEETSKMISSIRILEEENVTLKKNHQCLTSLEKQSVIENGTKTKKLKTTKYNKTKNELNKHKTKNNFISVPNIKFKNVTVIGDSHARHLPELMKKISSSNTAFTGLCKPGAGLLDILPTSTPPADHCYVLLAGSNDVDSGREDILFRHMEYVLKHCRKQSKVIVVPLTTRHDLPPTNPVHEIIDLLNNFIAELCYRLEGVQLLDIGEIGRHHYTAHGLHLRASGKRALAEKVIQHLTRLTPSPCETLGYKPTQFKQTRPSLCPPSMIPLSAASPRSADPVSAAMTMAATPSYVEPLCLPYENYAEAVKRTLPSSRNIAVEKSPVSPIFLGNMSGN